MTQWTAGTHTIIKEKTCQNCEGYVLDYLVALLVDANNFPRQAAKASHTICHVGQNKVNI